MIVIEKKDCNGCGACHDICPNNCIEMQPDSEGFLYPVVIEENCISCRACERVCHVTQKKKDISREPKSFIAWNRNDNTRAASTSGGIFSALADNIISKSGIVVGAAFDQSYHLRHTTANSRQSYFPMMGSKYLQSDMRGIYRQIKAYLNTGNSVLFTGTPCQVAGLHAFLNKKYDRLFTCEVICHGVPSPGIYKDYLYYLESKMRSKVVAYQFRSKIHGWSKLTVCVKYANGNIKTYRARYCPYHTWFGKHLSLRPSCYQCSFRGINREADITIGDFWGIENYRSDIDRDKGVSVILANSEKGISFLNDIKEKLYLEECPIDWVVGKNPCLIKDYPIPVQRETFFSDYRRMSMKEMIQKYPPASLLNLAIQKIYRTIGIR